MFSQPECIYTSPLFYTVLRFQTFLKERFRNNLKRAFMGAGLIHTGAF